MKKEISPEMYNYNKFPGPSFARVGDKVVAENIELDLVEDYRDAFDQTVFGQRFSQIMLKFDYIVGDWGNEQLRLKGFYKDEKAVKTDIKISRLEDYLTEFCNFGCAYFVLENPNPQELPAEPEEKPKRRRSRNNRNRNNNHSNGAKGASAQQGRHFTVNEKTAPAKKQQQERRQRQDKKKSNREIQEAKRGFVIRQK
ncbi:YutD family protein [Streptococcus sp. 20-1249]|uniref:YutD family protein n=1 Tax=Streptococcus hepaticus TaxID=3349163 RepID=UPI003749623B